MDQSRGLADRLTNIAIQSQAAAGVTKSADQEVKCGPGP